MPFAKVTTRTSSPSSLLSVRKPGATRWCTAPKSRSASHTWSAGARSVISLRMEVILGLSATIGFEPVADRIDHERPVVVRRIVGAHTGLAVVASAGAECCGVERRAALLTRRVEAEMKPGFLVGPNRRVGG